MDTPTTPKNIYTHLPLTDHKHNILTPNNSHTQASTLRKVGPISQIRCHRPQLGI